MQEFKNFEMLSSTSIQKLHKKKKQRKKYQNFSHDSGAIGQEEIRNTNSAVKSEITEKASPSCMDLKDFPELKVSGYRIQKFSFESNSSGFTNTQQWLSVISSRNKKKSNAAFPALPRTENLKKQEVSPNIKTEVLEEVVSEKNDSGSTSIATGEERQLNTKLKEKKPSQKADQPRRNPNKKKRSDPVFINLQDILTRNKVPNKGKKQNILGSKLQRRNEKDLLSGNFLDSANPKRSRGKHREIKKKKLTNFKMTIIKERILKSKIRENAIASQFGSKSSNLLDTIDFNSEIKIYLSQLNDKKLKNSCNKKPSVEEDDKKIKNQEEENVESKSLIKKKENIVQKVKQIPQITAEGEIKFSSKFKEYCDNIITPDLNSSVIKLIEELIKLQDRLFSRDPIKAKAKKRHVSGIREVRKYLTLKKVKLILIAPNLEKLQMEGSVFDSINDLKSMAESQNVPYGFALDRYKLGRCSRKNVAVSAFAVLNYEGLEVLFENVLQQLKDCKTKFSALKKPKIEEDADDVNSKVLSTLVTAFQEALKLANDAPSVKD